MEVKTVKLTSKRQATFPASLLKDLGLRPGDELALERSRRKGEVVWILRSPAPRTSWIGSLKRYARGKSHRLKDIRAAVGKAATGKGSR